MSNAIVNLLLKIGADSYEVNRMAAAVTKDLQRISKACHEYGKAMTTYVTVPLAATAALSIKNADQRLQGEAKLLKALHGRADIQQRLLSIAGDLQSKSTLDDDTITQQMAFFATLQLTEGQIVKNTMAAIDMSYALQDQGVTFEMAAKNIAGMYSGTAGRIGKLVPELANLTAAELRAGEGVDLLLKKYSGTASYLAGQGLNPLIQVKNALGDLSEEVGLMLIPTIQDFAHWMLDGIAKIEGFSDGTKVTIVAVGGLVAALGPALMTIGEFVYLLPHMAKAITMILTPIGAAVVALTAMGTAILYIMTMHDRFLSKSVSEKTQKYLSSGATVAELKKQREVDVAKNIKWNNEFEETKDNLNPLRAKSAPAYFGNYVQNKKNYEEEFAMASHYYSNVKALDEAIKIKELSEKQAAIERSMIDTQSQITSGLQVENETREKTVGLVNLAEEKVKNIKESIGRATSVAEISHLNNELVKATDNLERLRTAANNKIVIETEFVAFNNKKNEDKPAGLAPAFTFEPESKYPIDFLGIFEISSITKEQLEGVLQSLDSTLQSGLQDIAVGFGEGIGGIFAGLGFDNIADTVLMAIGNMIKRLGAMLISASTIIIAFKKSLASLITNPFVALALGISMVAMGAMLTASISQKAGKGVALANGGLVFAPTMALVGDNRGAGSDPEVVAPLSKLKDYGLGSGGGGSTIQFAGAEFVIRGSDLVLSLSRENARIGRING